LTPQDSKRRFSATPTLSTNVDDAAYAVHNCADPPSDSYEGHRRWNNLSGVSPSSDLLTVASSRRFSSTPDVLADLRGADCCQDEEDDRRQVIQHRRRGGSIRSLFPHLDSRPDDTPSPSGTSAAAAAVSSELSPSAAGVKVAVRIRPLVERELQTLASAPAGSNSTVVSVSSDNPKTLLVHQPSTTNILSFCFDHCLDSTNPKSETYADQNSVYEKVGLPLLDKCLAGYNCCLFAYGMTSSGKTHTVMGAPVGDDRGLLPRFLQDLFQGKEIIEDQCEQLQVDISYYEIYNERIHDLLAASHDKSLRKVSLKVREHPTKGPFVEGLSVYSNVRTYADVMTWLALGNKQRATASTDVNQVSSRSHTVCTLGLKKLRIVDDENKQQQQQTATNTSSSASSVQLCISSRVNIVDLAGSERQSVAGTTGDRLREGSNINRSLLTLGKVISLLSERVANEAGVNSSAKKSNNQHIPYRESMLTWLLRDSLGGNSQTVMIATVSPAPQHIDETLSTLRYATKARSIVNLVRVNEDKSACMIRTLQAELERLRQKQLASSSGSEQSEAAVALAQDNARQALEISDLRDQLQACKRQAEELENWKLARLQAEAVKENCPAASSDTGSQTTPKLSATISTSPPVSAAVVNPAAPSTPLRHRQLSIVDGGCTASANLRRLSSTAAAGLSAVSANVSLANSSIGSFSPMLAPISPAAALEECL
uniref:Kinesin-like protein n=1 Tax=Macrostomum lignano TaxID=282301 RepID=A0A1I8GHR8_9PLAT